MHPRLPRLALLAPLLLCARIQAAGESSADPMKLPAIVVTDSKLAREPEAWRYTRMSGFEVLSSAPDSETRRVLRDLARFQQAVGIAWPSLAADTQVPGALILCGKEEQFALFRPKAGSGAALGTISVSLRDREQAAIALDMSSSVIALLPQDPAGDAAVAGDSVTPQQAGFAVDHDRQLHREYMHFLFSRVTPRPAPWLEEGLSQLFIEMTYSPTLICFGRVEDPRKVSAQAAQYAQIAAAGGDAGNAAIDEEVGFNTYLAHGALMPMDRMFAMRRDSPEATATIAGSWPKQCAGFIHLCLYGQGGKLQPAFFDFVNRSAREPVTEDLFKACFHKGYQEFLSDMRDYAEFAVFKFSEFKPKKGERLPDPPALDLRDATQAEVGRIKGDALRLAGNADEAHETLVAPYVRGERDPELLAAIGLDEAASGHPDRARRFLEAAAAAHSGRARAYLELAVLRMDAAGPKPFSPPALSYALTPLFTARKLGPALPEVYEAIARAWSRSATDPSAANLGVLDEGVRLFPTDSELIYSDIVLKKRIGAMAAVPNLISLGIATAPDEATRARFKALQSP